MTASESLIILVQLVSGIIQPFVRTPSMATGMTLMTVMWGRLGARGDAPKTSYKTQPTTYSIGFVANILWIL